MTLVPTFEPDEVAVMRNLGVKFVRVFYIAGDGTIWHEAHIEGPTLDGTVAMTLKRFPGSTAAYPWMGRWAVVRSLGKVGGSSIRPVGYYDTQEGAEMVAIHSRG